MANKKKKNLLGAMARGRQTGGDLAVRRNPTEMPGPTDREAVEAQLVEAEARVAGALWERELAATSLRSVERSLDGPRLEALQGRIDDIRSRLDKRDEDELGELRRRIEGRALTAEDFRAELARRPSYERDAFTQRLLYVHQVPERETERPAGMVHYLPSPMDAILAIADQIQASDVFVDIGSGLGLVTMLVSWLSGAKAVGVELEPAYHRHAEALQERLGIGDVTYVSGDAREIDYTTGTVFYLYDTFRGQILEDMIAVFERRAAAGPIRVISRGESNAVFRGVEWLSVEAEGPSKLLFLRAGDRPAA